MNTPKRAAAATSDVEPPKLPRGKRARKPVGAAPAPPPPSPVPTAIEMAKLIKKREEDRKEPMRKAAEEFVEREAILFEPRMCKPENWGTPTSSSLELFRVSPVDRWNREDLEIDQIYMALVRRYESSGYRFRHYTQDGAWVFVAYIPFAALE